MSEIAPPLELDELDELEDLEDWEQLAEGSDWEAGPLRRRRRPVRRSRRRIRRPAVRRRPVRATRRRVRSPLRKRRPVRRTRRSVSLPRWRRRPLRRVRRYIPVPLRRWRPITLPPVTITVRPGAILTRFRFERASLRSHHYPQIRSIARHIAASWRSGRPIRTVRLVGHTDNRGSARFNRRLGMQRARAVQSSLIREINAIRPGLSRRITFVPQTMGEAKPITSNRTATGRAFNRRVSIFLSRV